MITQCPKTGKTCEVTGCNGCWKAEQAEQEPVGSNDWKRVSYIRETLNAEQAEQEPVAWLWVNERGSERLEWEPVRDISKWKSTPLYAAPVRTKDLTDEEVWGVLHDKGLMEGIRAVIAADREKNK